MKPEDRYLKFVRWDEEDRLYIGYCPDLFPWGGVCHAESEDEAFRQLRALVRDEVEELQQSGEELPPVSTRPMREAARLISSPQGSRSTRDPLISLSRDVRSSTDALDPRQKLQFTVP